MTDRQTPEQIARETIEACGLIRERNVSLFAAAIRSAVNERLEMAAAALEAKDSEHAWFWADTVRSLKLEEPQFPTAPQDD